MWKTLIRNKLNKISMLTTLWVKNENSNGKLFRILSFTLLSKRCLEVNFLCILCIYAYIYISTYRKTITTEIFLVWTKLKFSSNSNSPLF